MIVDSLLCYCSLIDFPITVALFSFPAISLHNVNVTLVFIVGLVMFLFIQVHILTFDFVPYVHASHLIFKERDCFKTACL